MAKENLDSILIRIEKHLSYSDRLVKVLESLDKKFGSDIGKTVEKTYDDIEKLGKTIKKTEKDFDDFGESTKKSSSSVLKFGENLKNSIPQMKEFVKNSFSVGKSLLSFDTNLSKVGYSLRSFGAYGSKLNIFLSFLSGSLDILQSYVDILKAATISTVEFKDGMSGIIIAANKAGMTLENYAKFLENYSGAINRYGLPSTIRMIEGLRSNAKELYLMGLSVSEVNDYFGSFLEQQRFFDNRRLRTEAELQNMFKEQMKMTYELASITGKSFSEVFRSITEKFKDPRTAATIQLLSESARKEFIKFIEMFPSLENIMLTSVQKGAVQFSDEFVNYATSVMPELINISEGLKAGTIDAKTAYQILRNSIKNISEDQMKLFALQGDHVHSAVSRLIIEVNKINEQFGRVNKEGVNVDGVSAALLEIENAMTYFSSQVRSKFLETLIGKKTPEEVENIFKEGRIKISSAIEYFMDSLNKLFEALSGKEGRSGLENLIDVITNLITSVGDSIKWLSIPTNFNLVKSFFMGIVEVFKQIVEFVKENPLLGLAGGAMFFKSTRWLLTRTLKGIFDISAWLFDMAKPFAKRGIGRISERIRAKKIPSTLEKSDTPTTDTKEKVPGKVSSGRLRKLMKWGGLSIPGIILGVGADAATSMMEEGETKETTKSVLTGVGLGATIGGAAGSVVPLIGTATGSIIGGAVGGLIGVSDYIKKYFIDKMEEINKDIQDLTLPPAASLEKMNEELRNINKGINNIEKQFADLNKFSRESNFISGAILRENKESNEKMESFISTNFMDNMA